MHDLIYGTGLGVWCGLSAWIGSAVLIAWLRAASYFSVATIAVIRHGRWHNVAWRRVPLEFVITWWRWLLYGPPDSLSGPLMEWRGIFDWHIKAVP